MFLERRPGCVLLRRRRGIRPKLFLNKSAPLRNVPSEGPVTVRFDFDALPRSRNFFFRFDFLDGLRNGSLA